MTNTSDEYWSVDGVSLHQEGWSIATIGGSRYDIPTYRGEDVVYPHRPGSIWSPKVADARTITLIMWATGVVSSTGEYPTDQLTQFNDNWDYLRRLFYKPIGGQITLTRRWYLTVNGSKTLVSADGKAYNAGNMSPTMTGRTRADFTVDLVMPVPFFFGNTVTYGDLTVGESVTAVNPGHDIATFSDTSVTFYGPLTNPRLTNYTPEPDVWVQYSGTIGSGDSVTLDMPTFTATRASDSANVVSYVNHSGNRYWFGLNPGNNTVTFSGTGAGTCDFSFKPPYI